MIATGESGHIFSPHYRDLAPLWIAGKSITLAGSEDELKRAGAKELVFTPRRRGSAHPLGEKVASVVDAAAG